MKMCDECININTSNGAAAGMFARRRNSVIVKFPEVARGSLTDEAKITPQVHSLSLSQYIYGKYRVSIADKLLSTARQMWKLHLRPPPPQIHRQTPHWKRAQYSSCAHNMYHNVSNKKFSLQNK